MVVFIRREKGFGVVGGLGPETTSEFYLALAKKARQHSSSNPSILIDSVPVPFSLESRIIQGTNAESNLLPLLLRSVRRLNRAGVDFIVIPCNTAHIFIDKLRRASAAPIISIVELTAEKIDALHLKRIGLLATSKTVFSKLYDAPLASRGITIIKPTGAEQKDVSSIITKILEESAGQKEKKRLLDIAKSLQKRGAQAIVLACTDLGLLIRPEDIKLPLLDTTEILLEATFDKMNGKKA